MISVKEMIAVMQAYDGGARVQARTRGASGTWIDVDVPSFDWFSQEYRIRPIDSDEVDWGVIDESFKYMARDEDGTAILYKLKPSMFRDYFRSIGESFRVDGRLSSYRNNGKDWKDSLVERPSLANKFNEEE